MAGQAGATWAAQPANVWVGGGEWSLHALQSGTVLLTEGSGRMFRSETNGLHWLNVSSATHQAAAGAFNFTCHDECGSWTVFEVPPNDPAGLPAGVYHFVDTGLWHSATDGQTWAPFSVASSVSGHMPRNGKSGKDEFFSQSQTYRRRDGTFLHSPRMNTAMCDGWAGEQLWQSNDTRAEHWRCRSRAAGGICDAGSMHTCTQPADEPTQCVGGAEWLKPGNHYSHWLRLRDGRLLLTWTHRNNVIDDDGFGTGTREHPHQTLT